MQRTVAARAAGLLAAIAVLCAFSTPPSKGNRHHPPVRVTATGAVVGSGQTIEPGRSLKYLSIVSTAGDGWTEILIKSNSITAANDTATFFIAAGSAYEYYFADGIDSLNVTALAPNDSLSLEIND